jgi:hypothetical protein
MTGDRYRPLTAAAVLLVAAIAAVVSYMHVATLALAYGQPPAASERAGPVVPVAAAAPWSLAAQVAASHPAVGSLPPPRRIRPTQYAGAKAGRRPCGDHVESSLPAV